LPVRQTVLRHRLAPFVFTVAVIVLFGLFFVWPGALGLIYSFTDYSGVGPLEFVGPDNYVELAGDPDFWGSLVRTFLYAALYVPVGYALSLWMASLLVTATARGRTAAKVVFFIPWLVSPIVTGVVWRWMFGENFGFVNFVIDSLGGKPVPWSSDADLSLVIVVLASSWAGAAFNMLLFVAALKNVPQSYYEAAALDGAGPWRRFLSITLPSIAPTSFLVVLLSTINAMKEFAMIQALNGGGPGTANRLVVQYIYDTGFGRAQVGYASAASMVLMVVLLVIALVQLRFERERN
jgi:alpha-1,4-digalacturonate transport system permease protein